MTRHPFATRLRLAHAMIAHGGPPPSTHVRDQLGAAGAEARTLHDRMGLLLPVLEPGRGPGLVNWASGLFSDVPVGLVVRVDLRLGRALASGEPVWLECLPAPRDPRATLRAPVGIECASPEALDRTEGQELERCAGCRRGVYYGGMRAGRHQALCSKRCLARTVTAKQRKVKEN